MSRLTSAQVIGLGEYLNPDFDPTSLTVSQLLGVLGFHNINFPSPYTKPRLVQLFNDEIKAKSAKFKKERLKKENSLASDEGITDGLTGHPIGGRKVGRRSDLPLYLIISYIFSGSTSEEVVQTPLSCTISGTGDLTSPSGSRTYSELYCSVPLTIVHTIIQPKRRRSSAQPNLGGPSRKAAPIQPALFEESEPEEDGLPVRKIGRSKKTVRNPQYSQGNKSYMLSGCSVRSRRVPSTPCITTSMWQSLCHFFLLTCYQTFKATEDSGWEDNNIFQSGAESSSPVRPSPVRPKPVRKNPVPRRPRKSMSAPPQLLPSSPPRPSHVQVQEDPRLSPPQSRFEPQLPSSVSRETRVITAKAKRTSFVPVEHRRMAGAAQPKDEDPDDELDGDSAADEFDKMVAQVKLPEELAQEDDQSEEDQSIAVSRRIAQGGKALTQTRSSFSDEPKTIPLFFRILFALIVIGGIAAVVKYKMESAPIGYCDTGSNTNSALEELKGKWNAVEACNKENRTHLYLPPLLVDSSRAGKTAGEQEGVDLTPCPLPPLIPLPHPTTCTPCPEHATCTQHRVICNTGYILRSHPLLFFLPYASSPSTASLSLSSSPIELIWKVISEVTDGLPGLGSVGLPPRCLEDPKRKRNIGVLGKAIEARLGQERGRRVCTGEQVSNGDNGVVKDADGGEAKRWGVELEELRDVMKKKTAVSLDFHSLMI